MRKGKLIHLLKGDNEELNMAAAEVNAKSKASYIEDVFLHLVLMNTKREAIPEFEIAELDTDGDVIGINIALDTETNYHLRLLAVTGKTNPKVYMQSFLTWLASEHKANGRVWIDDTPARALPIRMRK